MREVIAKQEKTAIALVTALAVFSLPGSIMMLRHPMAAVRALAIIGIAASAFAALAFGAILLDMRPAIERVDDTLVIIPARKRITLAIKDITAIRIEEFPPKSGNKNNKNKKYQLVISTVVDGESRTYEMAGVHQVEDAFVRLNKLLEECK